MSTLTEMFVLYWFSLFFLFLKAHYLTKAELCVHELYFQLMQLRGGERRKVLCVDLLLSLWTQSKPGEIWPLAQLSQDPDQLAHSAPPWLTLLIIPKKKNTTEITLNVFFFFLYNRGNAGTQWYLWQCCCCDCCWLSDSHQQQPQPFRSLISFSHTRSRTHTHE